MYFIIVLFSGDVMAEERTDIHSFDLKLISGESINTKDLKGKVLLIVNTASNCGFTSQYKELQALHEKYGDQGLEVLAFPSNDFGEQEPGSNEEIQTFCEGNYGVTFNLFEKIVVRGEGQHPLYAHLVENYPGQDTGPVKWNFEKFLITPEGEITKRFRSNVSPKDPQVINIIETLLSENS